MSRAALQGITDDIIIHKTESEGLKANPTGSHKIRLNIIYDISLFSVIHLIGKVKYKQWTDQGFQITKSVIDRIE